MVSCGRVHAVFVLQARPGIGHQATQLVALFLVAFIKCQVWPLTQYYYLLGCKKIVVFLEGHPSLISFIHPTNYRVSVSHP